MRRTTTTTTAALRPRALRPPTYVCRSCLSSPPASPAAAPPGRRHLSSAAGYAPLRSRRLIALSGPDAARYLQGVVTADVHGAGGRPRDRGFYTAFLNAQGRLLHDVFVYPDTLTTAPDGESFLIEVDAAEAERLQKHIKRYKLRAKFAVRLLDRDELSVWQAWDDGVAAASAAEPGLDAAWTAAAARAGGGGSILLRDPRAPGLGYRLVAAGGAPPAAAAALGLDPDPAGEEAYRVRRYLRGVAEGQSELERERALPHEANLDLMGAVDFHKGCYVGQELTIRTQHRGVVRKRVLPCALYAPGRPAPDRLEYRPAVEALAGEDDDGGAGAGAGAEAIPAGRSIGRVGRKGRSAGRWLGGVGNLGLALCRLEIMTDASLPGGEAAPEPHGPEAEFVIEPPAGEEGPPGQAVRVKAFVPDWLRAGIETGR